MNEVLDRRNLLSAAIGAGAALATQSVCANAPTDLVHDDIAKSMGDAELSLLFRGNSAAEFAAWRKRFQSQLAAALGDSSPPKKWSARQISRHEEEDHVRLELLLVANGTPSLPVYLLLPRSKPASGKLPAVLCVHGHGPFGHHSIVGRRDMKGVAENIEKHNYDYGLQFVRRGYAVAAPCMIPFGPRVNKASYGGNDPCAVTFVRMQALGRLPITANLRDLRWAIDLLQSRAEVADDRIGCAGLSYGGRMTMMAAAMDNRIRVASISGALNLLQERMMARHSCGSQMIPGLLKYGDYSEIGSLIAPRPCVWETGSDDPLIVPKWDEIFRSRLRRAYEASNAAKQLYFDRFDGWHVWSGRVAFPLFDKILKA